MPNFWAGLPPCHEGMPDFQRVYEELKGDFLVVGVDIGPFVRPGSRANAQALLASQEITCSTAYAPGGNVA